MLYRAATSALVLAAANHALAAESTTSGSTCYDIKAAYQGSECCNDELSKVTDYHVSPPPPTIMPGANPCEGTKLYDGFAEGDGYFLNQNCTANDGIIQVLEQAGANVTKGYVGGLDTGDRAPITEPYYKVGLCPVNVHWHLGAEHYSAGQFDEHGKGPHSEHR